MALPRVALAAKQLFGLRPAGNDKGSRSSKLQELQTTCNQDQASPAAATDRWTISAFFKSPRPLEGVQQVLRPLAAAVRPPRRWQAAHAAVIPEEEAERGAGAEEAAGLQHAVAIEPVLPQEVADSLDAMLAAADLRSGVRSSHSMAALQTLRLAGRQQSQCDAEGARLSALARELAAVQQHVQLQAGLLAECRARTAGARQQARQVQARLARSQARAATVEQEETEMRAATEQERQQAAQQIDALQTELLELTASTVAERRQLEHAAAVARRRTAGIDGMALQHCRVALSHQYRCERMAASHVPLTAAEVRRREREMEEYRAKSRPDTFDVVDPMPQCC